MSHRELHLVRKDGTGWVVVEGGATAMSRERDPQLWKHLRPRAIRAFALVHAVIYCRAVATTAANISLRVHDREGKIIEERTYPRLADPRETAG